MRHINNFVANYATPYLVPNNGDECPFKFFCDHNKEGDSEYFISSKHAYENYSLSDKVDAKIINRAAEEIRKYYGFGLFFDKQDFLLNCSVESIVASLIKYSWDSNRTVFSREYDRIICTDAFRRLQYKTQVMVNSASDDQRTRLLHSLEVQKIARKISLGINANWELAETIAIAHDIGHTPFGHEGETSIKHFLQSRGYGVFSHALQSVKVLEHLCVHPVFNEYNIRGLLLSIYVLEGVLKHDSDTFTDGIKNLDFQLQYDATKLCGMIGYKGGENAFLNKLLEQNIITNIDQVPQVLIGGVESQIVAWADKIAYLGHDWEEFVNTGLLEKMQSRINEMVVKIEKCSNYYKECESLKFEDKIKDVELKNLHQIWCCLQQMDTSISAQNNHYDDSLWNTLQRYCIQIIQYINDIQDMCKSITVAENFDEVAKKYSYHQYFSASEYTALKNYFIVTCSWVNLLDVYPKPYGMKSDPIYLFYKFLQSITSNVITPNVVNKIIYRTTDYIQTNGYQYITRDEMLENCNKLWIKKYNHVKKMTTDSKEARRILKKTVRTCFFVGFHDKCEGAADSDGYIIDNERTRLNIIGDDAFKSKYLCMLNINSCINDEFIGSTRVKFMKHTAHEIITTLMEYYFEHPDMLPYSYRNLYNRDQFVLAIKDEKPEIKDSEHLIDHNALKARAVADYVASMTDRMAKMKYDEITSSDTKWSNEYTNK